MQVDVGAKRYETSSEMSIEFEVDGPYKVQMRGQAVDRTPMMQCARCSV